MAGPFVTEELFDVTVKYIELTAKSGAKVLVVVKTKEMEQRYGDKVMEIHTMWVQPNWKLHNDVVRQSMKLEPDLGQRVVDWNLFRQLSMETFMRAWDIKSDKDEPVPCTKENMATLDPNIAVAMCDAFHQRTSITEQELGN